MNTTETLIFCITRATIVYIFVKGVIAISRPMYFRWRKLTYTVGSDGRPQITYETVQSGYMTREEEEEERKMVVLVGLAAERPHINSIEGSNGSVRYAGYGHGVSSGVSSSASYHDFRSPSLARVERPNEERVKMIRWEDRQEIGDSRANQPVNHSQSGSECSADSTNGTARRRSERLAAKATRRH